MKEGDKAVLSRDVPPSDSETVRGDAVLQHSALEPLDDELDELDCSMCGGDGFIENDDPLWHGFDVEYIDCWACRGTGLRKNQTVF